MFTFSSLQREDKDEIIWDTQVKEYDNVIYECASNGITKKHYHADFLIRAVDNPEDIEIFIKQSGTPSQWQLTEATPQESYFNFLEGIIDFLESEDGDLFRLQYSAYYEQLKQIENKFWIQVLGDRVVVAISQWGRDLLNRIYRPSQGGVARATSKMLLTALVDEHHTSPENVVRIIESYKVFRDSIPPEDDQAAEAFPEFSKALIQLINKNDSLGVYREWIPEIAATVVVSEARNDHELEKYLRLIFQSDKDQRAKDELIEKIIDELEPLFGMNDPVLVNIVSKVSDYYLHSYDLEKSKGYWDRIMLGFDPFFSLIKRLHGNPGRIAKWIFAIFIFFTAVAYVNSLGRLPNWGGIDFSRFQLLFDKTAQILLALCFFGSVPAIAFLVNKTLRGRLVYSQLFLPRLVGASLAGIVPLLLDNLPWDLGLKSYIGNFLLLSLLFYFASFAYILLDVAQASRGIPDRSSTWIAQVSSKVFLIGFVETLIIVSMLSGLFFPITDVFSPNDNVFGIITSIPNPFRSEFGFFPNLIFLWTGLSLFVGAFIQLIWQNERVTAPIYK